PAAGPGRSAAVSARRNSRYERPPAGAVHSGRPAPRAEAGARLRTAEWGPAIEPGGESNQQAVGGVVGRLEPDGELAAASGSGGSDGLRSERAAAGLQEVRRSMPP